MYTFLCYPKCTTCQKAEKWLKENGIEYTLREIKTDRPKKEEIELWQKKSGLTLNQFFNTSGLLYRAMELKKKLPQMSPEEKAALLATDGMLVKRPILIGEDFVLVGFSAEKWSERFK